MGNNRGGSRIKLFETIIKTIKKERKNMTTAKKAAQVMGGQVADPFDGAKEVQVRQISFSKVGDHVVGYYTNQKDIVTQTGPSKIYEIKGLYGLFHLAETTTDENGNKVTKVLEPAAEVEPGEFYTMFGGKDAIDGLFRKAKFGQKIGIKFEQAIPSKVKGHSAFKVFKPYLWADEFDPDMGASSDEVV